MKTLQEHMEFWETARSSKDHWKEYWPVDSTTAALVSDMSIGDLRKLLRFKWPETKGDFSAHATKDQCLAIITSTITSKELMKAWDTERKANPPKGRPVKVVAKTDTELSETLTALKTLMPTAHKIITDRLSAAATDASTAVSELAKAKKAKTVAPVKLTYSNGEVTIHKKKLPVITGSEMGDKWLAEPDPAFKFNAWRAVSMVAGKTIQFDWKDFADALIAGERILLVGPPGVGKTALVWQLIAAMKWPGVRYNGSRDATPMDLVGSMAAKAGSTHFDHGPLPLAMQMGAVFLNDEMDHNPPEVNSVLHSVMERNGKLLITSNSGEVVEPHENFRIVATANTRGQGDATGIHSAALTQDAAFISRFDVVFDVTWLKEQHEKELLVGLYGDVDVVDKMIKTANDCRAAFAKEELMYPVTTRHTMDWARLTNRWGVHGAFAVAVLGKMPDCDRKPVSELAQRHFGKQIWSDVPDKGGVADSQPF